MPVRHTALHCFAVEHAHPSGRPLKATQGLVVVVVVRVVVLVVRVVVAVDRVVVAVVRVVVAANAMEVKSIEHQDTIITF